MKAKILSVLMLLALVSSFAFAQNAPAGAFKIGWITKTLDNPYWVDADDFVKKTAEMLGVKCVAYSVGGESQLANEVRIMEDLTQMGVNAIIMAPVDSQGIIPAIQEANAAKIPVVTVDTASDGGVIACHVAIDNIKASALDGEAAVRLLNGSGKIAILEGILGQSTGRDRLKGFHSVIDKYPNIKVLASLPALWEKAKGMTVAEDILSSHSDIDLMYCCNDQMALGAVEAIRAAGKTGKIKVIGFDGAKEALEAIKAGTMAGTSMQNPRVMAVWSVVATLDLLKGKQIPNRLEIPRAWVTRANVDEFLTPIPMVDEINKYLKEYPKP